MVILVGDHAFMTGDPRTQNLLPGSPNMACCKHTAVQESVMCIRKQGLEIWENNWTFKKLGKLEDSSPRLIFRQNDSNMELLLWTDTSNSTSDWTVSLSIFSVKQLKFFSLFYLNRWCGLHARTNCALSLSHKDRKIPDRLLRSCLAINITCPSNCTFSEPASPTEGMTKAYCSHAHPSSAVRTWVTLQWAFTGTAENKPLGEGYTQLGGGK